MPEPTTATAEPSPTASLLQPAPEPALAPEPAGPQPAAAAAVDPRALRAATRAPAPAGGGVVTGPPQSTAPLAEPATPALQPDDALEPVPARAPDTGPSPTLAKPDAPALAAQAPSAPASRSAAPLAPDGPVVLGDRIEPSADLVAGASIRSEPASSQPLATTHQPASPAPPASVGVQLGVQIAAAVPNRIERLFVQLEPPALGRVEIRLEFSRDNRVSALIAADRHDTLDVLQRDSRALERALQDAGLRLNDNGLSFSLRQDQRQQERGAGLPYTPLRFDLAAGPDAAQPADVAQPVSWFGARRVLDIRI